MTYLTLHLAGERRDTSSNPVLVDVDQVEAVIPYRYIRDGYIPAEGSTVVTRSGERIHVAESSDRVQELIKAATAAGPMDTDDHEFDDEIEHGYAADCDCIDCRLADCSCTWIEDPECTAHGEDT